MTVTALVTLADAHAHLNLPATFDGDLELAGFIEAATKFVEFQTGPIIARTCTEVHNGGGARIVLDNPPILSMTSVVEYVGNTAYTLTQTELGTSSGSYSYSVDDLARGVIVRRWNGFVGPFVGGTRNIAVAYTAGLASVPPDIRLAVLEDIRGLYTQTQYGQPGAAFGGGIGSEPADSWSVPPMRQFPRLAALLEGPSRTPSIA